MRKNKGTKEKVEAMEAERQTRIDALPEIQRWAWDRTGETMEPDDNGDYVRLDDYAAMTEWLRAENARLRMGDTWPEQRKGYEAEVMRLQLHLERGKNLLRRVTAEAGEKQGERDMAFRRLESLHKIVIYMAKQNSLIVDLDKIKEETEGWDLEIEINDKIMTVSAREVSDGTDTGEAVVSASSEGDTTEHADTGLQPEQNPDIPDDL